MKIETLKSQLAELRADLRVDQKELERLFKDLKDKYSLNADEIEKRMKQIDIELEELEVKEKRLLRKIKKDMDEINGSN